MAPVKPHWQQPSHPDVQEVRYGDKGFTTKSYSKVNLPPFALFSKLAFPPCDVAGEPTYATVQFGQNKHLNLNSDLLYINHSCEPSLIFDTGNLNVIAGPKGLTAGEELSFFYPSTEWHMAQPFDCLCGKPTCRSRIGGAKDMPKEKMEGLWVNGHIREMLEEQGKSLSTSSKSGISGEIETSENGARSPAASSSNDATATGTPNASDDPTTVALKDALKHAEKVVEAARCALQAYMDQQNPTQAKVFTKTGKNGIKVSGGDDNEPPEKVLAEKPIEVVAGSENRGVTSRELSGEMGGDTMASNAK
ncbi:galactose-proton symport [Zalerion maritima]|uniref:Galactose-proton symport n=1 Tax=Zalerion maritima TaxID=339359 RepID=A0AAD5S639_9PEZI|nr:galactose-proton symport [Zalerion maritima]